MVSLGSSQASKSSSMQVDWGVKSITGPMPSNAESWHVPALDGVRGVAVLLVAAYHTVPGYMSGGFLGVDIFFVLSGYLITNLLLKEQQQSGSIDFRAFYVKRALRLAPALAIAIVLAIILMLIVDRDTVGVIGERIVFVAFYLSNWAWALNWCDMGRLTHTWSLAIEEQFYLIWPLTFLILIKKLNPTKIRFILLLLIALVGIYRAYIYVPGHFERVYAAFDTRADSLLVGCLLAFVLHCRFISRSLFTKHLLSGAVTLWLVAFTVLAVHSILYWSKYYYGLLTVVAFGTAMTLGFVVLWPDSLLGRALAIRPLRYIGKVSYGLYLYHCLIVDSIPYPQSWPLLAGAMLNLLIAFALALLSFHFVEQPVTRLRRRLISKKGLQLKDPHETQIQAVPDLVSSA